MAYQRPIIAGLVAGAVVAMLSDEARATYACTVMPSKDGFVALRDAPSTRGKVLMRATSGHVVVILQKPNGDMINSGSWHRVFYYPGDVVPEKTDPAYGRGREGWMHKRYVNECG